MEERRRKYKLKDKMDRLIEERKNFVEKEEFWRGQRSLCPLPVMVRNQKAAAPAVHATCWNGYGVFSPAEVLPELTIADVLQDCPFVDAGAGSNLRGFEQLLDGCQGKNDIDQVGATTVP